MICDCLFHRRGFFRFGAGLAATAGLMRFEARAQAPAATTDKSNTGGALPARGEYVLRGGHVLTMDSGLGDFPAGDVHVRDGAIVAVGAAIDAPGAQVIEARDMIVMPGFVDTHWHLWCTSLRMAIRADDPKEGYFPTTIRVGRFLNPQDSYAGVRLGLAEGLLSGITTVHNFSHNTVSPAHADAELQAMTDLGVRGRFSYGSVQGLPADQAMNIDDVARVQKQWTHADGMLTIGANLRTPGPTGTRGSIPVDMFRREFDAFRKLGVPMTIHCGPKNLVALMGTNGLLGSDMLMVHPQGMSAAELKMVGDARSPWSAAPVIEMSYSAVRNGTIQYNELAEMDAAAGIVDRRIGGHKRRFLQRHARADVVGLAAQRSAAAAQAATAGRTGDDRGRQGAGPRRKDRVANTRQARGRHRCSQDRHQHGTGWRSVLRAGVPRPARQR